MKKILGMILAFAVIANMAVLPSATVSAEEVNYDDYVVDESISPENMVLDPDNINGFFRHNGTAGELLRDYKSGQYFRWKEKKDPVSPNYAAGPTSWKQNRDLSGGLTKDETYVISVRLKNDTYNVKPEIDFVVSYDGKNTAVRFNVNSAEYQTFADSFTAKGNSEGIYLGFDALIDRTKYTDAELGIINIDLTNGGSFYMAEEVAYDVSLVANKKEIPAGDSIICDATMLNQVDIEGELKQNFEFVVLNSERTQVIGEGFTFTPDQADKSRTTLNVADTVTPGDYVVFAKSADYEGFQKGIGFTVKKPVIGDTPAGTNPLYEVKATITEGDAVMGIFDTVKIKAELVNDSGEIGTNAQEFKWMALDEERIEEVNTLLIDVSEDTTEATITLDIAATEGIYYIVAESVADESKGMRKGVKIEVDKSGTVADIRDNLTEDTAEEIEKNLSRYLEILEISDGIAGKADVESLSKIIAASDKGEGINPEISDIQAFVEKMAVVSLYNKNENNVTLFDENYDFLYADKLGLAGIDKDGITLYSLMDSVISKDGKMAIQSALKGKGYESYETFMTELKGLLLTHAVAYPKNNGIGYLDSVLTKENIEAAGIDGGDYYDLSDKSAFHETIAGKVYSVTELEEKLKAAEEGEEEGEGGSYNPPENTSGKAPVGGGSFAPVVKDEEKEEEENKEFDLFDDVPKSHWAYIDIYYLKDLGIISGISEEIFAPDKNITREQFLKLVIDAFKIKKTGSENIDFEDVEDGAWYEEYVNIGVANGIIKGVSSTQFGVGAPITRQDVCVILSRALELDISNVSTLTFDDAESVSEYAKNSVSCLVEYSVIKGFEDNTFGPEKSCTRAQGAKIISSALAVMNAMQ